MNTRGIPSSFPVAAVLLILFLSGSDSVVSAETLTEQCSNEFTKVTDCLAFVTGKAASPTKQCCTAITGIKEDDPKCLCFIIQQVHNGSAQIRSLGLQEGKLLQLPSACNLKNTSVSDCPSLLGLSPSSPDAAIFSNNSTTNSTVTTPATATNSDTAGGVSHGPDYVTGLFTLFAGIMILVTVVPPGLGLGLGFIA